MGILIVSVGGNFNCLHNMFNPIETDNSIDQTLAVAMYILESCVKNEEIKLILFLPNSTALTSLIAIRKILEVWIKMHSAPTEMSGKLNVEFWKDLAHLGIRPFHSLLDFLVWLLRYGNIAEFACSSVNWRIKPTVIFALVCSDSY